MSDILNSFTHVVHIRKPKKKKRDPKTRFKGKKTVILNNFPWRVQNYFLSNKLHIQLDKYFEEKTGNIGKFNDEFPVILKVFSEYKEYRRYIRTLANLLYKKYKTRQDLANVNAYLEEKHVFVQGTKWFVDNEPVWLPHLVHIIKEVYPGISGGVVASRLEYIQSTQNTESIS